MAATVGVLRALLELDTAQFEKGVKRAQNELTRTGRELTNMGSALTKAITVPLAGAATAAVAFGLQFDSAMKQSVAIMDVTQDQYRRMEDAAKDVGRTTVFSATQAAESFFFLASAGLDAERSIGALSTVATFAQAGMFGMQRATDLLTDAQSALGLASDDASEHLANMTRIGDVLVKANTMANASVEQFAEALTSRAGAALRLVNKDVEEGAAVLAVFADQGIKGAEAGTRLDVVLRDLQTRAVKNSEAMERYGVSVFDANDNMRPMADIVKDLENAFEGMSDKQKRTALTTMQFQDRSVSAMLSLVGFSDKIRDFEDRLRDAGGTMQTVADKQMEALANQFWLLWERAKIVGIDFFQNTLVPIIQTQVIPGLKMLVGALEGAVEWFSELPHPVQMGALALAGLAAAAGPVLLVAGQMAFALKALLPLFGALSVGFGSVGAAATPLLAVLAGPLGLAVALGLVAGGMAALITHTRNAALEMKLASPQFQQAVDQLSKMKEAADSVQFNQLAFDIGVTSAELVKWLGPQKENIDSLLKQSDKVKQLKKALDEGVITQNMFVAGLKLLIQHEEDAIAVQADHLDTIKDVTGATAELTEEQKKAAESAKAIVDEFRKAINPSRELGEKLRILERAGFDQAQIFRILEGDIRNVYRAHAKSGEAVDSLVQKYSALSLVLHDQSDLMREINPLMMANLETSRRLAEATAIRKSAEEALLQTAIAHTRELIANTSETDGARRAQERLTEEFEKQGGMVGDVSREIEAWGEEVSRNQKKATDWGEEWGKQVSLTFDRLASRIADAIVDWKGFGNAFKETAKGFAKATIEILVKELFNPFKQMLNAMGGLVSGLFSGLGKSIGGWLGGILGGQKSPDLGLGAGLGGALGKIGGFFTNPLTAIIGGGLGGIFALSKLFSKSVTDKFRDDFARDFGGVKISDDAVNSFLVMLGVTEKQLEHIRKDIAVSPIFLQYAHDVARAQGASDRFLQSLESIETSWGSFNFREAFEAGLETDNWKLLNDAFLDAFQGSTSLTSIFGRDLVPLLLEANEEAEEAAEQFAKVDQGLSVISGTIKDELVSALNRLVEVMDTLLGYLKGVRVEMAGVLSDAISLPSADMVTPAFRGGGPIGALSNLSGGFSPVPNQVNLTINIDALDGADVEHITRAKIAPELERLIRLRQVDIGTSAGAAR